MTSAGLPFPVHGGSTAVTPLPLLSGHRGTLVGAPESTLATFQYAKAAGAAALEFDVRWTADGRMVVLHDHSVDRTTDCSGALEAVPYATVAHWDAGSWYGPQWSGTRVPTFASVLRYAAAHGLQVNPEVKPVPGYPFTDAKAQAYVELIHDHVMQHLTVVSSVDAAILSRIKSHDTLRQLRYSLITDSTGAASVATARASGTVYMPDYRTLTHSSVAAYHSAGIELWVWPIRNLAELAEAAALGPDALVVDDPAAANRWLARHI